ncbi:MAG: UDP-N-acetylmuramate dehydrogenase [Proteobacteria bacterium]|nr:UDP-N-acetylmuramate dehydrogenase [Pseudomonadota bacterium]MDE3208361.1 UDP-N-acetylmuramate dehydrogenase [Pseudomonadota bacterium]
MAEVSLRGRLEHDVSMSRYVSWRAGGVARRVYEPADLADLSIFLRHLPSNEAIWMLGLGSNLLVRDGGIDATIISMHPSVGEVKRLPDAPGGYGRVYAQAGVASPKMARFCAKQGLSGAAFLAGIPGTVGGALAMNAGCFGSQMWEIVSEVETINRQGQLQRRDKSAFEVGYRSVQSLFSDEEWFTGVVVMLVEGDSEKSRQEIRELLAKRIKTQPLDFPNAGSVFRNPPGDYAARLIEACGLKGYEIGGAQVSCKHANFIINKGDATAADIEALIGLMEEKVLKQFGIRLVREVRIIGVGAT